MTRRATPRVSGGAEAPRRLAVCLALAAVLAAGAFAGCTRAEPVNPNLLVPKIVVGIAPDNSTVVYVHSAIIERAYDRIELSVENETIAVKEDAYSLERRLNVTDAFIEVNVVSGESRFAFRGIVRVDVENERVRVSTLDANGKWADPRLYSAPFGDFLDREGDEPA